MLADEPGFYQEFTTGNPELLSQKRRGNERAKIIRTAAEKTALRGFPLADHVHSALYNSKNDLGLYRFFQHAVHLVTVERTEIRTTPENFNFIFKNPSDDDIYHLAYTHLPAIMLLSSHVILELFDRIRPIDGGARRSFTTRSILAYKLIADEEFQEVKNLIVELLGKNFPKCAKCRESMRVTAHNAARFILTDTFRCTNCHSVNGFPFSWIA